MARGSTRAPSQHAYRGAAGRTQTQTVHVAGPRGDLVPVQVVTVIDAVADPELVDRLHSDDPARALNSVRLEGAGEPVRVAVPVLYHDPAAELLVLVLGDAHRHRELDERIRVLERLRADEAPVPAYAKEPAVVYGASGLRAYLERRAHDALEAQRIAEAARDLERRRAELAAREAELERARGEAEKRVRELERRAVELETARAELAARAGELDRARLELERLRSEARARVIAQAQQPASGPVLAHVPAPLPHVVDLDAEQVGAADEDDDDDGLLGPGEATLIGPPPSPSRDAEPRPLPRTTDRDVVAVDADGAPVHKVDSGLLAGVVDAPFLYAALESLERELPDTPPELRAATSDEASDEASGDASGDASDDASGEGDGGEPTGEARIPAGADPLTTSTEELSLDPVPDVWPDIVLERPGAPPSARLSVDASGVKLGLTAPDVRPFGGALDLRLVLHRVAAYPVIALVIGPPAALRVPIPAQLAVAVLDIASDRDRAVLAALARRFELVCDVISRGRWVRRARLAAPLHDNVGYVMRAAEDHLRAVAAEGEPSLQRAREAVLAPGFDLLGTQHPDAAELRVDRLAQLETAQEVRRAISIARKFARPAREDYLICTRGLPLPRWRELRRGVLEAAVRWGLWTGSELAQVAVSEGLARSRRDLVVRLDRGFELLRRDEHAFDIDADAADDNAKAIAEEARALGVELQRPRNGVMTSDESSTVSGSIGGTPARGLPRPRSPSRQTAPPPPSPSVDELIAQLEDKHQRLPAALQLGERGDPRAAAPVIAAAAKMGRADAVRVLGMSVKFGAAAKVPLLEGLASSKAYLRHGCALALALLRDEDGTQAVIELLMTEPTEIWREVARAIGQVGPPALLPLASTYGRLGDRATPALAERVAWAMAHVAVRGGRGAVETMAGGQSVVAPVARHALDLHATAARDHVRLRPGADGSQPGRDVTVNRAFSRRFFEALEQGMPGAAAAGLTDLAASSHMETLDEADLIEEDEEAELDESDLIQT